jgi:methionyl aminopeptidase
MSYVEASDVSLRKTGQIKLHGASGFAGMRKAGALVAKCLDELTDLVKPGAMTSAIDEFVRDFAFSHGAYPATLMYRGYRYSTCTSINHVVCHGMPGDKVLKEGDIVNVDVTFIVEGWYGDSSRMYAIGPIARKAERLVEVTYEAMMRGIAAVKPGATTGDIGHAIQSFVEPQGMSVVRDFCGHGLGRLFHDEPNIIHIGRPGEGVTLKPGMFFTIEPMINLGKPHVKILSDGWTAVTRDRSLSAQFEHSVGVTATGVEIFTLSERPHELLRHAGRALDPDIARAHPGYIPIALPGCKTRAARHAAGRWPPNPVKRRRPSPPRRRIITAIASGCASDSTVWDPTR